MSDSADRLLAPRFAALANPVDDSDWLDVRRRARTRHGRRWLAVPLAAGLAALLAGSAFALYRELVDFHSSEPAPERIVIEFGRMSVRASVGLGPEVEPGAARKVAEAEIGGSRQPLYLAPTRDGGFCWRWGQTGSCGRLQTNESPIGAVWLESARGPAELAGHLLDDAIVRLDLEYENGERVSIPIIWVSPPIDAGFYAFDVPPDHLRPGRRAKTLVALDGDGEQIAAHTFRYSDPRWEAAPDGLPRAADRSRKRTLFDLVDHRGERWALVVAPAPGDRLCWAYGGGGGCVSPRFPATIGAMGVQGGAAVNVCCAVAKGVADVELAFEDGQRTHLKPVEGFLLYVISPEHYPRGHRLESIVWRDAAGREVARRAVAAGQKGIYPCKEQEEIQLGYGETICP